MLTCLQGYYFPDMFVCFCTEGKAVCLHGWPWRRKNWRQTHTQMLLTNTQNEWPATKVPNEGDDDESSDVSRNQTSPQREGGRELACPQTTPTFCRHTFITKKSSRTTKTLTLGCSHAAERPKPTGRGDPQIFVHVKLSNSELMHSLGISWRQKREKTIEGRWYRDIWGKYECNH